MEKRNPGMIVLNAEPLGYSQNAIESWTNKGYTYQSSSWDEIDNNTSFDDVAILIVRLGRKVDTPILNKFPKLTHLVSATTGQDHIDVEALNAKGVQLVSLKSQLEFLSTIPSTAEHTWALLLALIRKIPAANNDVKAGEWQRDKFRGVQLKNKTIGIIGLGRTGSRVAKYALAFDMKVQYFDPFVVNDSYHKCSGLTELLSTSDIISLHVHLTTETTHLLAEHNLMHLKQGCIVINTSRGKVVDEAALTDMLVRRKISGVASDVLSTELDDIRNSPLWQAQQKNENIIITPHLGGATCDAMWACEEFIVSLV